MNQIFMTGGIMVAFWVNYFLQGVPDISSLNLRSLLSIVCLSRRWWSVSWMADRNSRPVCARRDTVHRVSRGPEIP
eukprot:SAG31_NODE_330_length_17593_cov_4.817891_18_plen_76_part_00